MQRCTVFPYVSPVLSSCAVLPCCPPVLSSCAVLSCPAVLSCAVLSYPAPPSRTNSAAVCCKQPRCPMHDSEQASSLLSTPYRRRGHVTTRLAIPMRLRAAKRRTTRVFREKAAKNASSFEPVCTVTASSAKSLSLYTLCPGCLCSGTNSRIEINRIDDIFHSWFSSVYSVPIERPRRGP